MKAIGMRYLNTFSGSGIWEAVSKLEAGALRFHSRPAGCHRKAPRLLAKPEDGRQAPEHPHPGSADAREASRIMGPFISPRGKMSENTERRKKLPLCSANGHHCEKVYTPFGNSFNIIKKRLYKSEFLFTHSNFTKIISLLEERWSGVTHTDRCSVTAAL